MNPPRTPRRSRHQWVVLVQQFHESGLRAEEFCQRHELVLGTFRKYLYKKPGESQPQSERKPSGFSAVKVPTPSGVHPIQIDIGRGVQVSCPDTMGMQRIAQLALALRHGD